MYQFIILRSIGARLLYKKGLPFIGTNDTNSPNDHAHTCDVCHSCADFLFSRRTLPNLCLYIKDINIVQITKI